MAWKRFPVPEFDRKALRGLDYAPPEPIAADKAAEIAAKAEAGDASVAGGYAVEPDGALLERLSFGGEAPQMILCAVPGQNGHVLARSWAWFNQRAYLLDRNAPDAEVLHDWRTPRPNNTRFGPEDGVALDRAVFYILNGRMLEDGTRANRLMFDSGWSAGEGRNGFRVIAACDTGGNDFNNSCFEVTWDA